MPLRENITPYTNFASSSKVSVLIGAPDFAGVGGALRFGLEEEVSPTATTKPDVVIRVFLGLVNSF